MAATYPHMAFHGRNPFDAERPKRSGWTYPAVVASLLVHGAFFLCLLTARFTAPIQLYSDQATDVALVRAPPPPPPPKASPVRRDVPPPVVQPRQAARAPLGVAAPPSLEIAPVAKPAPEPVAPPVATAPPAPPPPPRAPVITNPVWSRLPNADDIARYYPERALRMGVIGQAVMHCHVTSKGAVELCAILAESPSDQEFGAAALKMTRLFVMRPQTRDGEPVDGAVLNIVVHFTLPPA